MDGRIVLSVTVILSVAAIVFLGSGISGMLISQSCCFGPQCSPETLCDNSKLPEKNSNNIYIGIMLLISLMLFLLSVFGKVLIREKDKKL
jgi:hypothetical protein